jgi:hypothetical protein
MCKSIFWYTICNSGRKLKKVADRVADQTIHFGLKYSSFVQKVAGRR